jgi:hypothetical protein
MRRSNRNRRSPGSHPSSKNFASFAVFIVCAAFAPVFARAGELNLGTMTCASFQSDILNSTEANQHEDALDVVMWIFGYAVAKSGAQVMYGDALQQFGNALDTQCKENPASAVLDVLGPIKFVDTNPMDLTQLGCTTYEQRHVEMTKTDAQGANTLMMWLYGFSAGKAGGRVLDSRALPSFADKLAAQCSAHPESSLYAAVSNVQLGRPKPVKPRTTKPPPPPTAEKMTIAVPASFSIAGAY